MMADFVTPRHSAVMERLRRRIEAFRQRHNLCESRYEAATQERLELERQHTMNLHQRLLQNKAKRASKHRQPQPSVEQDGQRAAGAGPESGGTAAEQSRNSTRAAVSPAPHTHTVGSRQGNLPGYSTPMVQVKKVGCGRQTASCLLLSGL